MTKGKISCVVNGERGDVLWLYQPFDTVNVTVISEEWNDDVTHWLATHCVDCKRSVRDDLLADHT